MCCNLHNINTEVYINLIQINDYFWINGKIVKQNRQMQKKLMKEGRYKDGKDKGNIKKEILFLKISASSGMIRGKKYP